MKVFMGFSVKDMVKNVSKPIFGSLLMGLCNIVKKYIEFNGVELLFYFYMHSSLWSSIIS